MDRSRFCELCQERAAIYCCADEAYVCWDCDSKVHGANFIVARHSRSTLCCRCQSPTGVLAVESSSPLCPTCSFTSSLSNISRQCIHSEHSSTENHDLAGEEEVSSKRHVSGTVRSRSPSPVSVIPTTRKRKNRASTEPSTASEHQLETVERLESVLRCWEKQLGLDRSRHRVWVAMQLLTRTAASIKANRLPKLDARAVLAVCLWISLKLEDHSRSPFPRVDWFGRCTGITPDVLLTMEGRLCDELSTHRTY